MYSTYHTLNAFAAHPALAADFATPGPVAPAAAQRVVRLLTGKLAEAGLVPPLTEAEATEALTEGRAHLLRTIAAQPGHLLTAVEAGKYSAAAEAATTCTRVADLLARLRREMERRRAACYTPETLAQLRRAA